MCRILVRAMEPKDYEAVAEIRQQREVIFGTLQVPLTSHSTLVDRMARGGPDFYPLVAEMEETIVGTSGLHVEANPRRRHCGSIGIMVHKSYQGRGVGTALLTAIVDLSDNWLGLTRLELEVYTDNAAAIHLYEKFGFEIEGTHRQYALQDGKYINAYSMARLLP